MEIVVCQNSEDAARRAAIVVAAVVRQRPAATVGLATGRTMVLFYRELIRARDEGRLSFRSVTIFALDEYRGTPSSHPESCRGFLDRHLLRSIDVAPAHVRLLDGQAPDPSEECARYERAIADAGGIDIQLLGIGGNGHIGFNEPGSSLDSRTRLAPLSEATRRANEPEWGGDAAIVPAEALTMGIGTIMEARTCVLLAFGAGKAAAVAAAVEGPVTSRLPASVLQRHRDARFFLDEDSASLLKPSSRGRRTTNGPVPE